MSGAATGGMEARRYHGVARRSFGGVAARISLVAGFCLVGVTMVGTPFVWSPAKLHTTALTGAPVAPRTESRVALRAQGNLLPETIAKKTPKGWQRQLMKRMPDSRLGVEEIMQRITTVLIRNVEEKWRDAPMKTTELMKEIGLRGMQIKTKRYINPPLQLLMAQNIIYKVKQNPIRWEIHEDFREYGLPPISRDKRAPWRLSHLLKFERTTLPRYGPIHGYYKPEKAKKRDFSLPLRGNALGGNR